MPKLPILSGDEIIKAFSKLGYEVSRQRGSHIRLACDGKQKLTVPNYPAVSRGLLRKILRDAKLSTDAFINLLD